VYITSWISPVTIYDFDAQKDTFAKSIFNSDVTYPASKTSSPKKSKCPATTAS